MLNRFRRHGRRRGQAVTELALITPLALLMILGGFDLSVMGTDTGLSVAAVRHGARLAAEIGGTSKIAASCTGTLDGTNPAITLAAEDQLIVQSVLAVTKNMSFLGGKPPAGAVTFAPKTLPEEIDIYRPSTSGSLTPPQANPAPLNPATDHYDKYVYNDSFATFQGGTTLYQLDERCQGPLPNEAEIGVRMIWSYLPASGIPGPSFTLTEFAIEKMSLCSDNCTP